MTGLARSIVIVKTDQIDTSDEFFNPLKKEKHFLWNNVSTKSELYGSFNDLWNSQGYVYTVYEGKKIKAMMGLYLPKDRKVKTKIGISILKAAKSYYEYYDELINRAITTARVQGCFAVELVIADVNKYIIKKIKSNYDVDTSNYDNGFVKLTIYTD